MELKDFNYLSSKYGKSEKSLILGNGFSQSFSVEIFNYKNLLDRASFGSREDVIRGLFEDFDTFDFEKIMRSLEISEKVLMTYGFSAEDVDVIERDKDLIKNALILVLLDSHPERSSSVSDGQYRVARNFIFDFSNVFNLNYDLLLYWIVNKSNVEPFGYYTDDGFRHDVWDKRASQNIFYLHGGIHIYDDGLNINKHCFRSGDDVGIIDSVRANLDYDIFPLFVSEPTSDKKLYRIKNNQYLNYCYDRLKEIEGAVFVHGHSVSEADRHVFDQINKSRASNVFIGIYGDPYSESNRDLIANARRFVDSRRIVLDFYDSETAVIWG